MAEQQDLKISPSGIWSAPAAVEAPPGALAFASEIVIRRKGLAQPRPGFTRTDLGSEPSTLRLIPFFNTYIYVYPSTPLTEWADLTDIKDEDANHLSWSASAVFGITARKNLYLTTSDVLRKVTTAGVATAYQTGAPVPAVSGAVSGTNGNAVEAASNVGYYALTRRKDANDLVVRSGVSGRVVVTNPNATLAKQATVTIYLSSQDDYQVGDTIEIYRTYSIPSPALPLDEGFLCKEIELTSSLITAGTTSFTDNILDLDLGRALYVNESQEGIGANHIRPPKAASAALFNGSLFLGNLTFPPEIIISWTASANATNSATEVGGRIFTGDFTNGSADIANVTPTTGLQVGQIIGNTASEWSVNTEYVRITAINGSTVTMSRTYSGSTGTKVRTFYDSIRIGSRYFIAVHHAAFVAAVRGIDIGGAFNPGGVLPATDVIANGIGDVSFDASPERPRRYVQVQAVRPNIAPFLIYATHGDQYEPPLPLPTATGLTVDQEIQPAGLAWSNNQEPEHFQLPNMDLVGDDVYSLMALAPMKNALLAYKMDGLHRASGAGAESGFRIEELDKNVRLLYPLARATVGDKDYAWADFGVYECDENGCTDVSNPAIRDILEPVQRAIGAGSSSAHGAWGLANPKNNEFILSVPDASDTTEGEALYVFNRETGTWVVWFSGRELKHGFFRDNTTDKGKLVIAEDQYLYTERAPSEGDPYRADQSHSITITTGGLNVIINGGSGWTPVVGDLVVLGGVSYLVTAVTDATHFAVDQSIGTGAATAYVAFTSYIEFIAATAKHPGLLKSWGEGAVWWDSLKGMGRYDLGFTSSINGAASSSQTQTITPPTGQPRIQDTTGEAYRFVTPRNHAISTRLYPSITVRQGGAAWALSAIGLGYRYMSDRVRSR